MIRVFLDAACWFAAAGSRNGGSSAILDYARDGAILIVVTNLVLLEAERNIRAKLSAKVFQEYMKLFETLTIEIVEPPSPDEERRWQDIVAEKDCHVLAGAVKARADVLITLDRKHILTEAVRQHFPIPVQDTKEFLTIFRGEA